MQLVNEFTVDATVDEAWSALTNIPRMAECIPGAQVDSQEGQDYHGRVGVKVGPVGLTLLGTATLVSQDDEVRNMVVRGVARDHKGQGSAEATITMSVRDGGGSAAVTVTTDLELGGRIAQFGSGVITQVSGRIIKQFVTRLNAMISAADPATTAGITAPETRASAPAVVARSGTALASYELAVTALAGIAFGISLGRALYARR